MLLAHERQLQEFEELRERLDGVEQRIDSGEDGIEPAERDGRG